MNCYNSKCDQYAHWLGLQKCSTCQLHKAGEKCFVDYCGPTVPIGCADTGEIHPAQVFVAVLGASNVTCAEATRSHQSLPDWLGSHVRAFECFGGCTDRCARQSTQWCHADDWGLEPLKPVHRNDLVNF